MMAIGAGEVAVVDVVIHPGFKNHLALPLQAKGPQGK